MNESDIADTTGQGFAARARILWGNSVHAIVQVSGVLVVLAGVLVVPLT